MPVDLRRIGESLSDAKTVPLVKEEKFEAIRMVIHKGHEMPGHWLFLPGNEPHSLVGIEDSTLR